jgi:endonuclease/exonuclease/phosphatase family metal-dependent hydrolase
MRVAGILFGLSMVAPGQAIATLNLAREPDASVIARTIANDPVLGDADILLFQEVFDQAAQNTARHLGYHIVAQASPPEAPHQGLAILSKHALSDAKVIPLKRYDLRFHSRIRFALAATVALPSGPVRVWNVHLDSRINPAERLAQIAPVLEDARNYPGPALLGGDLNTTRFRWLFNVFPSHTGEKQGDTVREAFEKAGFRTPLADNLVTFPFLKQHLDWIFVRGLSAGDSGVAALPFSDHYAVWVKFAPQ